MPAKVTQTDSGRRGSSASASSHDSPTEVLGARDDGGTSEAPELVTESSAGRYVVLQQVGHGAMGRVLRAYDPKLQREVALKEVRGAVLGASGGHRLVAEARAMARLSHPNVVAVYDVEGDEDDRVVLVMEYVAGQTLAEWLGEGAREWPEVVAHFCQAGRGLAAAHEAGLLHRDFKPTNVLVADGVVKVTDFGLAKLGDALRAPDVADVVAAEDDGSTRDPGTDELTEAGMVLGTPRYMAPEQHTGDTLTPAADQYAFCVALWEALCGRPPFLGSLLAKAKRDGPPPWPGGPTPRPVVDALLRGLSPDPTRRWPSMDALLRALAYDPTRRRTRQLQWAAGAAVVTLGAAALWGWSSARAGRCTQEAATAHLADAWGETRRSAVHDAIMGVPVSYAEGTWQRTAQVLDAYATAWTRMHVETCEATSVRGEQSTELMDLRMACLLRAKVELAAATAVLAEADAQTVQMAHEVTGSLRSLDRCGDVEALRADVEPPVADEAEAVEAIRGDVARAKAAREAGHFEEAREAIGMARVALDAVQYAPVRTEVAVEEGRVFDALGDYPAAEASLREGLRAAGPWRQWEAMQTAASELLRVVGLHEARYDDARPYADLARSLAEGDPEREATVANRLGGVLRASGKYEEAEAEYRRALALQKEVFDEDDLRVAATRGSLASLFKDEGKLAEAEAEHRRVLAVYEAVLGSDHPDVATSRNKLAVVLYVDGKYEEAEAEHRRALALRESVLGPDHPSVADSHNNLGVVLLARGDAQAAEAEFRRGLVIREKVLGAEHPSTTMSRNNLAIVLHARGKDAEAEAEYRRILALQEKSMGPGHPEVAGTYNNLGSTLAYEGKFEEAEAEHRRALELRIAALGPDHPDVAESRSNLATALAGQGRFDEAEAQHRLALAAGEETLNPDHPSLAHFRSNLASILLQRGAHREARELAEEAWSRFQRDDVPADSQAYSAFVLARALWETGARDDRRRAVELAERAQAAYTEAGDDPHVESVAAWLGRHRTP